MVQQSVLVIRPTDHRRYVDAFSTYIPAYGIDADDWLTSLRSSEIANMVMHDLLPIILNLQRSQDH